MELEARAFPQGPGTPPGCALARSLCRGAATALCLRVIWTVASLRPRHLAPPPPGTVGSSPHREASLLAESPFPGEFLVKSFPGHSVFSPLSYFCTGHGSGEGGPWRRADLVGDEERRQLMHPAVGGVAEGCQVKESSLHSDSGLL